MNFQERLRRNQKSIWGIVVLLMISLVAAGCGKDDETKKGEQKDPNIQSIQIVIEKEFGGPDKKYYELWEGAMKPLESEMSEEQYDAYLQSPEHLNFINYTEQTYSPYFTEKGLDTFIAETPAFFYSFSADNYDLAVSDISVIQNTEEPLLYNFTFKVTLEDAEKVSSLHRFSGKATIGETGKIEQIDFVDLDWLKDKLN